MLAALIKFAFEIIRLTLTWPKKSVAHRRKKFLQCLLFTIAIFLRVFGWLRCWAFWSRCTCRLKGIFISFFFNMSKPLKGMVWWVQFSFKKSQWYFPNSEDLFLDLLRIIVKPAYPFLSSTDFLFHNLPNFLNTIWQFNGFLFLQTSNK